ncbi:MAG: hypothetical protein ABH858_06310 [Candidatus Omnitrophota bacterium]
MISAKAKGFSRQNRTTPDHLRGGQGSEAASSTVKTIIKQHINNLIIKSRKAVNIGLLSLMLTSPVLSLTATPLSFFVRPISFKQKVFFGGILIAVIPLLILLIYLDGHNWQKDSIGIKTSPVSHAIVYADTAKTSQPNSRIIEKRDTAEYAVLTGQEQKHTVKIPAEQWVTFEILAKQGVDKSDVDKLKGKKAILFENGSPKAVWFIDDVIVTVHPRGKGQGGGFQRA